jgi:hypothetical protein
VSKEERRQFELECKEACKGYKIHNSMVFAYMKKEILEDGTEIDVPAYIGKTYYRDFPKSKTIRRPNLIHNNNKKRRLKKMELI